MNKSALELRKTPEGRKYLEKQQKKYWKDILQPGDPRFNKVYGERNARRQKRREKQEREAEAYNEEIRIREEWDVKQGFRR